MPTRYEGKDNRGRDNKGNRGRGKDTRCRDNKGMDNRGRNRDRNKESVRIKVGVRVRVRIRVRVRASRQARLNFYPSVRGRPSVRLAAARRCTGTYPVAHTSANTQVVFFFIALETSYVASQPRCGLAKMGLRQ